jgi:hypothetical protein
VGRLLASIGRQRVSTSKRSRISSSIRAIIDRRLKISEGLSMPRWALSFS